MNFYQVLEKAKEYIDLSKTYKLSQEEKIKGAIELAGLLTQMANMIQTEDDLENASKRHALVHDKKAKLFLNRLTDQIYRSKSNKRLVNQIRYLIKSIGIPQFLSLWDKSKLLTFHLLGAIIPDFSVHLIRHNIKNELGKFILPYDEFRLKRQLEQLQSQDIKINLNYLGEMTLSEKDAEQQTQRYIESISHQNIHSLSIKLSSLYSQHKHIDIHNTRHILLERIRRIMRTAIQNQHKKLIYFDMEHFEELYLSVSIIKELLESAEFKDLYLGIALQAYLPESFEIQQTLTKWAISRVENGGHPIRIRLVKGANNSLEHITSSQHKWHTATYPNKTLVDANFKRMLHFGTLSQHAHAVHLGIGTHNVFDIAYAYLERAEKNVEKFVQFEMIYGMNPTLRKTLQLFSDDILLYCPTSKPTELEFATAYLFRRLDEQTNPQNFLTHSFKLEPGSKNWENESEKFKQSCTYITQLNDIKHYRLQEKGARIEMPSPYQNASPTDWSLPKNHIFLKSILSKNTHTPPKQIPYSIGNQVITESAKVQKGISPNTQEALYSITLCSNNELEEAISIANLQHNNWQDTSFNDKKEYSKKLYNLFEENRGPLIQAMVTDTGKTIEEADLEVCEALDFIAYYTDQMDTLLMETNCTIHAKGTVLVCPPWNFPCAIPTGCIISALLTGNVVLFKPATESSLVAWSIVKLFWDAGIPKEVLQFIPCDEDLSGDTLIKHPGIQTVMLTGSTETAETFLKHRPNLDLIAETGGKNAIIVSNMCDRELTVKHICQSAFSYSGQKCSACSLVLCDKELYYDEHFRTLLKEATKSLVVGSAWNSSTTVPPLITPTSKKLHRALTQLEENEEWLLEPQQSHNNPQLWSPGIKLGVSPESYTAKTELFGPVIGIIPINNVKEGITIINQSQFGLTAGLESLDEREHAYFIKHTEAGNLYINKPITGAIVGRQPFGGLKKSSFGFGLKAGGPHYLTQLVRVTDTSPRTTACPPLKGGLLKLNLIFQKTFPKELDLWHSSLESYLYHQKELCTIHDSHHILGEENIHYCKARDTVYYRHHSQDKGIDMVRIVAAALICNTRLHISISADQNTDLINKLKVDARISIQVEDITDFIQELQTVDYKTVRVIHEDNNDLLKACQAKQHRYIQKEVSCSGRFECLNFLEERSISRCRHRYGFIS